MNDRTTHIDEVPPGRARKIVRVIAALAMMAIGVDHFVNPGSFLNIVPKALPAPLILVLVSGFFEVLGGLGLLIPRVRRAAGIGLVLLFVAVFPANINMVVHPELGGSLPLWALWARLPFQFVFIAVALWVSRD
jgi:uncharacterized membrane protein